MLIHYVDIVWMYSGLYFRLSKNGLRVMEAGLQDEDFLQSHLDNTDRPSMSKTACRPSGSACRWSAPAYQNILAVKGPPRGWVTGFDTTYVKLDFRYMTDSMLFQRLH